MPNVEDPIAEPPPVPQGTSYEPAQGNHAEPRPMPVPAPVGRAVDAARRRTADPASGGA